MSSFQSFRRVPRILCLLCLIALAPLAFAEDDASDPAVTAEKYIQTFTINSDGTYVQTGETKNRIGQERGIKSAAQQYYYYNATLENVEVLEAYTQKRDGRKVAVQPDQIKTQQEARSLAAPMFQDIQYKVVIFPDVAVGDQVYAKIKLSRHTALFPGHFSLFQQPAFVPYQDFRLIFDVPTSVTLHVDNVGFKETAPTENRGRKIYEWTYLDKKKKRIESGSVAYADYGDRIVVSTFPDYAAFAEAYQARAADKALPSPKIRELSAKLTEGINDPKDKTKALYDWVRKNIRYVAVFVGPGGVVPHAAETILDNRYGDCKDHVTLLEALLSAVGIESTSALINSGNAYRLPTVPSLGILNHAITYIPSLNLFLDSTAQAVEFGYLPILDLDKPVVLTKASKLARTPAHQPIQISGQLQINVTSEGSARFTSSEKLEGGLAGPTRFLMHNMNPSDRSQIVQKILRNMRLEGSGTVSPDNTPEAQGAYQTEMKGKIENLVAFPGPVGLSAFTSFGSGILRVATSLSNEQKRNQPFYCISQKIEEVALFTFPPKTSVLHLPKGATIQNDFFEYRSEYMRDGKKVTVKRFYQGQFPSAVCQPEDFKKMKQGIDQMMGDLRSQIVLHRQ